MSVPGEPAGHHNESTGDIVGGTVIQVGTMRDMHLDGTGTRDPWLTLAGVLALVPGIGLLAPFLLLGSMIAQGYPPPSAVRSAFGGVLPTWSSAVLLLLIGYLAAYLLYAGWGLLGRRNQAYGRDWFAGQCSLWLSLLVLACLLANPVLPASPKVSQAPPTPRVRSDGPEDEALILAALVVLAATAALIAVVRACAGGARRRPGAVVLAGAGAVAWFGPVVWVLWAVSGAPLPWQVVVTLALCCGLAVPVLAVVAMDSKRGASVLHGWALGILLVAAAGVAALDWISTRISSPLLFPVPVVAVGLVLAASAMLRGKVAPSGGG